MSKDQEPKSTKRRDFLKLAGLGTLAGTAAAAGVRRDAAAATPDKAGAAGYRETPHVKKFYSLARF